MRDQILMNKYADTQSKTERILQYPEPAQLDPAEVCKFKRFIKLNAFCSNTLQVVLVPPPPL